MENRNELLNGYNLPLDQQIGILTEILLSSNKLKIVLERLANSNLENYYIGAGAINQTVFNYYHGYDMDYGISDYDIVYFDEDLSYDKEDKIISYVHDLLKDIDVIMDIKNEARVHLWYQEKYGNKIEPYINLEDAINSWGTSITCIGVRLDNNKLIVYAPYGLNDLFSMTIRPIKKQLSKDGYLNKTTKWKNKWPMLKIMPWD